MVSLLSVFLAVFLAYVLGLASIGIIVYYSDWIMYNETTGEAIGSKNVIREAKK